MDIKVQTEGFNWSELDLVEAKKYYFEAGGLESDLGPRKDPIWYWRRASKMWKDKYDKLQSFFFET